MFETDNTRTSDEIKWRMVWSKYYIFLCIITYIYVSIIKYYRYDMAQYNTETVHNMPKSIIGYSMEISHATLNIFGGLRARYINILLHYAVKV